MSLLKKRLQKTLLILDEGELYNIIRNCLKGDRRSQRWIFDTFSSKMMTVCLRYTKNRADAEDVLQDGFVKVFTKMNQYSFKGSFEGWLRRIFAHTALRYISQRKSHVSLNTDILYPVIKSDNIDEKEDFSSQILLMISNLPEGYQNVFNLYVFEGFDHNEISEILQIAASTSRSQLSKARKILQNKIKEHKLL